MRVSRSVARSAAVSSRQTGMRRRIAVDAQADALAQARLVLGMDRDAAAGVATGSARRPSSSATSRSPVDEPMKTLMPAAPGSRSSSATSAALSCVPPTKKAKSQCMRPRRARDLVGKRLGGDRQRVGVGHLEDGGDAAHHRGARAGLEVFLVLGAGLAEMHLRVDDAGQDVQARCSRRPRRPRAASIAPIAAMRPSRTPMSRRPTPSWLTTVPFRKTRSKVSAG